MSLLRLITIIVFFLISLNSLSSSAFGNYKVHDIILDNSDRMIFIKGMGDFKQLIQSNAPTPVSFEIINNQSKINTFSISAPPRYVIDIPNATLVGSKRTYKLNNSSTIESIQLSQFSVNPHTVRVVITLKNVLDISKFKTYTNGENIVVSYVPSIIDNSIKYKFYTPQGDADKSNKLQDLSAVLNYNNTEENIEIVPTIVSKYILSQISQNSDGLILRGIGAISLQKTIYSQDDTKATILIDNAILSPKLENKTFNIPSSDKNISATLTLNQETPKKIQLTILGNNLKDYRFILAPDGQSLFITHRSYVINNVFSAGLAKATSYKITKNQNGYVLFDFAFSSAVAYNVFELNDNFYLDINNMSDYSADILQKTLAESDIKIEAIKISADKTRYVIPAKNLNFAYGNIESNAKSLTLCFKEKSTTLAANNNLNQNKEILISNINETINKPKETKPQEIKAQDNKIPEIKVLEPKPQENKPQEIKISDNRQQEIIIKPNDSKPEVIKQEKINITYIPKEEDKIEKKAAKPKKNKDASISNLLKVVLDPGHGGTDTGAISGNIYEKNINLDVALLVSEKLAKKNIHVYMTRDKDRTLTLEDRTNFSNEVNPNVFISIHVNSNVAQDPYGIETHYFKDDSYDLAQIIQENFASEKNLKKWDTKDRGVIKSRFYVINHTEAPSVLIEIGFISNEIEREKLLDKHRQEEIAESITKGILEYLKLK